MQEQRKDAAHGKVDAGGRRGHLETSETQGLYLLGGPGKFWHADDHGKGRVLEIVQHAYGNGGQRSGHSLGQDDPAPENGTPQPGETRGVHGVLPAHAHNRIQNVRYVRGVIDREAETGREKGKTVPAVEGQAGPFRQKHWQAEEKEQEPENARQAAHDIAEESARDARGPGSRGAPHGKHDAKEKRGHRGNEGQEHGDPDAREKNGRIGRLQKDLPMGMKHAFSPLPAVRRLFLNVAYSQFRFKVQPGKQNVRVSVYGSVFVQKSTMRCCNATYLHRVFH